MDQILQTYQDHITTPRLILASATIIYLLLKRPNMRRFLGHSKTTYHHAREPLQLKLKDGTTTTFDQLCKSALPPCRLNPFLFNGHLQTIWTAVAQTTRDVYYKRWIFEHEDPAFAGSFTIDFVTKPHTDAPDSSLPPRTIYFSPTDFDNYRSDDRRPMLVTLHGLAGGSNELYLREVLAKLCDGDGGWEACVVNSRGCANSQITSSVLYNARTTWDVRQAVRFLRERFPNRPFFGCGFSLGANMITNYIAEEGEKCEFRAAVTLSSPWNLEAGHLGLMRSWMGYNIYSKAMGTSLRALFEKHIDQLSKDPNLDVNAIRKIKHLHEFDALVQCPSWGYPTYMAYYRDASSTDMLMNIRIPYLSINAEDDPIACNESLPYEEVKQTPYAVLCTTELGGHLSWFELGGGRWFATAAANFLRKMAVDVDLDSLPKPADSARPDVHVNGSPVGAEEKSGKPTWAPVRRRWHGQNMD